MRAPHGDTFKQKLGLETLEMYCTLSGEVPVEPVVSKATGYLFEKRLISKYIKETGKCPVSGADLSEEDLVPVQASKVVKPKTIAAASIPGLLAAFQNEWDEVMLETFTLKQHLDTTRQELAQALYQQDASCRVIARLMRERDEARAALTSLQAAGYIGGGNGQQSSNASAPSVPMDTSDSQAHAAPSESSLDESVVKAMNDKCAELSSARKSRKPTAEGHLSKQAIGDLHETLHFTPHKASAGSVTCLAVAPGEGGSVLTGGADKEAILSSRTDGAVLGRLKGHSKAVTAVAYHPSGMEHALFTGSADHTVKVWRPSSTKAGFKEDGTFSFHNGGISAISAHPTGSYFVSTSLDGSWAFWDVARATKLCSVTPSEELSLTCGEFHPDGIVMGAGSQQRSVMIWDVRKQEKVASFEDHGCPVASLSFSENGFLMASGCTDGTVKIWDLRKLRSTKSFAVGTSVTSVSFDNSGLYLAVASKMNQDGAFGVEIVAAKEWTAVKELTSIHSEGIAAVRWGANSTFFATASADRVVRIYS